MNVAEAVDKRMSVRQFLDKPVPREMIEKILELAARAPSGGNLQPWHVWVVGGDDLKTFTADITERRKTKPRGEGAEYMIYPKDLKEPYLARRFQNGEELYSTIGIPREDKPARLKQFAKNFELFGAPVGIFFAIDRQMGPGQFADIGMYMQTIMLLAVEHGLGTCAQEAWANWNQALTDFLEMPQDLIIFAGIAIGYPDENHPINALRTSRADTSEYVTYKGL